MLRKLSASVMVMVVALFGSPVWVLAGDAVVAPAPSNNPIAADTHGMTLQQAQMPDPAVNQVKALAAVQTTQQAIAAPVPSKPIVQVPSAPVIAPVQPKPMPPPVISKGPVIPTAFPPPVEDHDVTPRMGGVDAQGRNCNLALTAPNGRPVSSFQVSVGPPSDDLAEISPGAVTVNSITAGTGNNQTSFGANQALTLTQLVTTGVGAPEWTGFASGGRHGSSSVIRLTTGQNGAGSLIAVIFLDGTVQFIR